MSEPLMDRRSGLAEVIRDLNCSNVKISEVVEGRGRDLFAGVKKMGLEGVMAKRVDGRYLPGKRSGAWKKLKHG